MHFVVFLLVGVNFTLYPIFRHILASLHFNENVHRDTQLTKEGEKYYKVTYPKFKLGEEVVREVAKPPTYSKSKNSDTKYVSSYMWNEMIGMSLL